MLLVVDANVIVQACIEQAGLGRLRDHELKAPPVMSSETISALHEMRYRGDLSDALATVALERFSGMSYEIIRHEGLWSAAWDVAEQLGWAKTYDAEYIALAQLLGCPLVTLDARLVRGASRIAQIIGVADLPA